MSETLSWNFVGNDRLTDVLDKLSVTLSSVDRKLSDFGKTSTKVKTETEGLEQKVKGLGDQAEKTGDKVKRAFLGIDKEIAATALELKALQEEFARTGDIDLFAKIGDKKSYQSKLSGIFKDLGGDAQKVIDEALKPLESKGGLFSRLFSGVSNAATYLGGMMPSLAPTGPVGIGVAGALAVPALAGAGGAVTGLAGIGAVGAGVAGAIAGDPAKFGYAWSAQIATVKKLWIDASKAFTGPTMDAIKTIGPLVQSWHIDKMFASAAGYVKPLVAGVEGFATGIMSGVSALVEHAGPVIDTLSAVLPQVGQMIGDGLKAIADNSQGGAQALGDILQLLGGIAEAVLVGVANFEALYGALKNADAEVSNFIRDHQAALGVLTFGFSELALKISDGFNSDEVQHFGKELDNVPSSIDSVGASAEDTAKKLNDLSDAFDSMLGLNISAQQAGLAFNKSLLDLDATIKKNRGSLNEHTAAGIADREIVLKAIGDAEKQRQANIANKMSVEDATVKYQNQIDTLRNHLAALHLTKQEIDNLIGAADEIPNDIYVNVHVNGAGMLSGLAGSISAVAKAGASVSSKGHRALGGAVMPGGVYEVNEQGVETFQPNSPGRIVPAGAAGGTGDVLGVLVVQHQTPDGTVIRTELLKLKRQSGLTSLGLS